MSGTFEFGEVMYTLEDIYVMRYNIVANTYSGAVGRVAAPQLFGVDPEHQTDRLMGGGRNVRLLSVQVGAVLNTKLGGMDFDTLAIMTGATNRTSDDPPDRVRQHDVRAGGGGLPYFGALGVGPLDDGGLFVAGLQACKLDKQPAFTLNGETNEFSMSEQAGYAIPIDVDGVPYSCRIKVYETASGFTAPTDEDEFLEWFADIS